MCASGLKSRAQDDIHWLTVSPLSYFDFPHTVDKVGTVRRTGCDNIVMCCIRDGVLVAEEHL